jgi:prolipoprotein diacylglyceryltransferase
LEFIKNDQVAFEANMALNMGQLLSIPFVIVGIVFIVKGLRSEPQKIALAATEEPKRKAQKVAPPTAKKR